MAVEASELSPEEVAVITRRYREARAAGLSTLEAREFAHGDADVGLLRKLLACGCPPALIARIVL